MSGLPVDQGLMTRDLGLLVGVGGSGRAMLAVVLVLVRGLA